MKNSKTSKKSAKAQVENVQNAQVENKQAESVEQRWLALDAAKLQELLPTGGGLIPELGWTRQMQEEYRELDERFQMAKEQARQGVDNHHAIAAMRRQLKVKRTELSMAEMAIRAHALLADVERLQDSVKHLTGCTGWRRLESLQKITHAVNDLQSVAWSLNAAAFGYSLSDREVG